MRILELINTLGIGGAERVAANLALDLQSRGQSVHILALRELREDGMMVFPEDRFVDSGVTLHELEKRDGFSVRALRRLAAYIRREQIDVVHTHNPLVHHYGVLAARMGGARAVVNTVHGTSTLEMQRWAHLLFQLSCHRTTRVVAVCRSVGEACRGILSLPASRSAVIYNGIELEPFLGPPRRRVDGRFIFGTVGRMVPVKDHGCMFQAFARAHAHHAECELHLLGDGELEQELRALAAKLEILGAVHFHGFSNEVAPFLGGIDCFLLSSRNEGLPMSILEAMAAGLPVVATSVGGVAELVTDAACGWLSPPREPRALAACMIQSMEAPDLEERGTRARQAALANYSVSRMGQEYLQLFRELLDAHDSRN